MNAGVCIHIEVYICILILDGNRNTAANIRHINTHTHIAFFCACKLIQMSFRDSCDAFVFIFFLLLYQLHTNAKRLIKYVVKITNYHPLQKYFACCATECVYKSVRGMSIHLYLYISHPQRNAKLHLFYRFRLIIISKWQSTNEKICLKPKRAPIKCH